MNNQRILVVEDSPIELKMISNTLQNSGYEVVTAKDGEEALAVVDAQPVGLIVLDVIMPKLNGFQVCRQIKTSDRHNGIKIILLTSKTQDSDKFWGKKQGADMYMTKPFNEEELLANVASLI